MSCKCSQKCLLKIHCSLLKTCMLYKHLFIFIRCNIFHKWYIKGFNVVYIMLLGLNFKRELDFEKSNSAAQLSRNFVFSLSSFVSLVSLRWNVFIRLLNRSQPSLTLKRLVSDNSELIAYNWRRILNGRPALSSLLGITPSFETKLD